MSAIDKLLAELCPDGVEYRKLGDISRVLRGKRLTKKQLQENGRYPVFHGGLSPIGYFNENNRKADCVMVINVGASAGTVGYSDCDFWSSDGCYCLACSNFLNQKFLYVVLKSQEYFIQSRVRHAGIPTLDATVLEALEIPVPPIEVQREIVRILDAFTALTDELTAKLAEEVAARKQQYGYYRDRLLSRESLEALDGKPVEMVRLGNICDFFNGDRGKNYPKKSEFVEMGIPFVNASDLKAGRVDVLSCNKISEEKYKAMSGAKLQNGDILYCLRGSTGKSGVFESMGGSLASSLVAIRCKAGIDSRFIFHILNSSQELKQRNKSDTGAAQPNLSAANVKNYLFPIPSLDTQRKVVGILDQFDALTTSLTDSLPAEIEARKAQYGYYRDRLLEFPRKGGAAA